MHDLTPNQHLASSRKKDRVDQLLNIYTFTSNTFKRDINVNVFNSWVTGRMFPRVKKFRLDTYLHDKTARSSGSYSSPWHFTLPSDWRPLYMMDNYTDYMAIEASMEDFGILAYKHVRTRCERCSHIWVRPFDEDYKYCFECSKLLSNIKRLDPIVTAIRYKPAKPKPIKKNQTLYEWTTKFSKHKPAVLTISIIADIANGVFRFNTST